MGEEAGVSCEDQHVNVFSAETVDVT